MQIEPWLLSRLDRRRTPGSSFPASDASSAHQSQHFSEDKRRPGDRDGHNWRMPNLVGKRAVRHIVYVYNTNWNCWKTFVHARLVVRMGVRGCHSLFGESADQHRLFANQAGQY